MLTSRDSLDCNLKLNSATGEKAKPFHQERGFEILWLHQTFSLLASKIKCSLGGIATEDVVGDKDRLSDVHSSAFRVKTQSGDCAESSICIEEGNNWKGGGIDPSK